MTFIPAPGGTSTPARQRVRQRAHGSAVVTISLTLQQGPDAAIVTALEKSPSMGRLVADALRAYIQQYAGLETSEKIFRRRKDGRLMLPVNLEFFPERDADLIAAIEAAPPGAVAAMLVGLMREGGLARQTQNDDEEEPLDLGALGLDL